MDRHTVMMFLNAYKQLPRYLQRKTYIPFHVSPFTPANTEAEFSCVDFALGTCIRANCKRCHGLPNKETLLGLDVFGETNPDPRRAEKSLSVRFIYIRDSHQLQSALVQRNVKIDKVRKHNKLEETLSEEVEEESEYETSSEKGTF